MLKKVPVLQSLISKTTPTEFIEEVFSLVEKKQSSYVCFANVHMLIEAHKDNSLQQMLNKADIVTANGRPVSLFMKWIQGVKQERICGMDYFPVLLREAEKRGKSVYFYGSTEEVLQTIKAKTEKEYPALRMAGIHSPPFRQLTEEEDHAVIDTINNTGADLVFVALGCPKQEKWMAEHQGKVKACMFGIGQSFLVYAGLEKRLPKWMRNLSMEWMYRLYLEPKRLWKRYLVGNSLFLLLTLKFVIGRWFGKSELAASE